MFHTNLSSFLKVDEIRFELHVKKGVWCNHMNQNYIHLLGVLVEGLSKILNLMEIRAEVSDFKHADR